MNHPMSKSMIQSVIIVILTSAILPISAAADSATAKYNEALTLSRKGEIQTAIDLLLQAVNEEADSKIADDALYKAGELAEREAGKLDLAASIYQRVLNEYPSSRNAVRAERALNRLSEARQQGDEILLEYSAILKNHLKIGSDATIQNLKRFLENNPNFIYADQSRLWIADEYRRTRRFKEAYDFYETSLKNIRNPEVAFRIVRNMGDTAIELRDFPLAKKIYLSLAGYDNRIKYASKISVLLSAQASQFILLQQIFRIALVFVGAWIIFLLIKIRWRLVSLQILRSWRVEAAVLSIPLLSATIYLWNRGPVYRHSFFLMSVFQILLSFSNMVLCETASMSKSGKALVVAGSVIASIAVAYTIFYSTDMINLVIDTIRNDMLKKDPT